MTGVVDALANELAVAGDGESRRTAFNSKLACSGLLAQASSRPCSDEIGWCWQSCRQRGDAAFMHDAPAGDAFMHEADYLDCHGFSLVVYMQGGAYSQGRALPMAWPSNLRRASDRRPLAQQAHDLEHRAEVFS